MEHASRFIVLGITKIGDSSIVVHTLSPGWGRRSFIVSASRKLSGSLLQPLSIVNGEVSENPKSELWRLHGMSLDEPLTGIRTDLHKNSMTMFMSEVLFRTLREGEGGEDLFDWCRRNILTLDALKSDFANYHLRFLLELAVQLGFSPSIDDLAPFAGQTLPAEQCSRVHADTHERHPAQRRRIHPSRLPGFPHGIPPGNTLAGSAQGIV